MPDRTLKKFCRLSKYIEQIDKDFYGAFEDLCLTHLLKPARGNNGITLIYPSEKSYRQKIINAAYSDQPEKAIEMLKSLILQDYYPTPTSFEGNVVNLLNQKVAIEEVSDKDIKISKDLKLEKDMDFIPMGYRENMAVYILKGKGEMPLNGEMVKIEKSLKKKGGGLFSIGVNELKTMLHDKLEQEYLGHFKKKNNVYVKKVCLQLDMLFPDNKPIDDKKDILNYLGNSEFADSYLLDNYFEKHGMAGDFQTLINSIDAISGGNTLGPKQFTYDDYMTKKDKVLEQLRQAVGGSTENPCYKKVEYNDETRLNNIQSPIEIRERIHILYNDDRNKIGKDLFIVFSCICMDLWMNEPDMDCAKSQFKNFTYLTSKVYNIASDFVKQEFDIARDLTLYGNLLKSDVFKFNPIAPAQGYPVPSELPSPLDMNKYSLSGYIAGLYKRMPVSGGDPAVEALLRG